MVLTPEYTLVLFYQSRVINPKRSYGEVSMNLIDGIGGAFLFSNNPPRLAEWYRDKLGMDVHESSGGSSSSFYATFEYRDFTDASIKGTTAWAILPSGNDITGAPRTGQINCRVRSMRDTLYGEFAWVTDPDGNKIELWEDVPETI